MKISSIYYFLNHLIHAGDEHSIHSPFVYSLYTEAIHNDNQYYAFSKIEALRQSLLNNQKSIEVEDFGAGSAVFKSNRRKISEIARYSLKQKNISQVLFRIIVYLNPKSIIELGTCLGVTTAYLASANSLSSIITLEGCPNLSELASRNLKNLDIKNAEVLQGKIEDNFEKALNKLKSVDLIFFDANHRFEPTVKYFETCLPYLHEDSILIFDDIYWSMEMKKAWEKIKSNCKVTISIDLYYFGIVFFRSNAPKQAFKLKL